MESDGEDAAIGAAEEMTDATSRLRRRAWMLARAGAGLPPDRPAVPFRRSDSSGEVVRGVDGPATFKATVHAGYAVLTIAGQLDVYTAAALRHHVFTLVSQRHALIVVDLTDVEFMDSGGLSALVGGLKRARQSGSLLRVVATRPELGQLFRVTGVYKVLPLYESIEAATDRDVS